MNKVITLWKIIQKIKGKEYKYFVYIQKSNEEPLSDADNNKIYFVNKFKWWFFALSNFEENIGYIQNFYVL